MGFIVALVVSFIVGILSATMLIAFTDGETCKKCPIVIFIIVFSISFIFILSKINFKG